MITVIFAFALLQDFEKIIDREEAAFTEIVLGGSQKRTVEWTAPSRAGTYKLVCTYHRGMDMTVNVK